MRIFLFLSAIFLGIQLTAAVIHSWKAFLTTSTGLSEFPEFVVLNLVDDQLMGYFDSKTNTFEAKQSWVMENLGQEYVEQQTNVLRGSAQTFKANIGIAMKRFNQSQGVHIVQQMYGCEWDDETQQVTGYKQYGYDGEDFLTWNMESNTYIASKQQAEISKNKWNSNRAQLEDDKDYYGQRCPDWLKKYIDYGRSSLMRTVRPSVSLLQKSSSSPVSCFATGFYPNRAEMFWRKDGEEIHGGVEKGEIIPNNDGTFQMSVDMDLSATGDWNKYECVFQLSGVNEDLVTKLEKSKILTNESNLVMIITIIAVIVVVGIFALVGYRFRDTIKEKLTCAKRPPTPVDNKEVQEEMIPKA